MSIEYYFPTPLYFETNENFDIFFEETESAIEQIKKNDQECISGRIDASTTKPNFLRKYNLFLEKYLEHNISQYVSLTRWNFLREDVDYSVDIYESWVNINTRNTFQHAHTHPNSQISGVYYHKCDGDEGDLIFYNPNPHIQYGSFPTNLNMCGGELRIPIAKGKLVLFPSWLQHKTIINKTDKERISIAFNAILRES